MSRQDVVVLLSVTVLRLIWTAAAIVAFFKILSIAEDVERIADALEEDDD